MYLSPILFIFHDNPRSLRRIEENEVWAREGKTVPHFAFSWNFKMCYTGFHIRDGLTESRLPI